MICPVFIGCRRRHLMRRTEWLQETRMARFEEAYEGWTESRLTQEEAARLLGVCDRTFRRWIDRYQDEGLDGLRDKRLAQALRRGGAGGRGAGAGGPVPDRAPELECEALLYLVPSRRGRAQLYLGEEPVAGGGGGAARAATGSTPQVSRGGAVAGDAAAPGREPARVGTGAAVGSDCHDGRCDQ